jgi:hypothetical protein
MFLVPLSIYFFVHHYIPKLLNISETNQTVFAGICSVISVWFVMGGYLYLVLKDETNFPKKDLKTNPIPVASKPPTISEKKAKQPAI